MKCVSLDVILHVKETAKTNLALGRGSATFFSALVDMYCFSRSGRGGAMISILFLPIGLVEDRPNLAFDLSIPGRLADGGVQVPVWNVNVEIARRGSAAW